MKTTKEVWQILFGQGEVRFTLSGIPIGYYFLVSSCIGAVLGVVLVKFLLIN